MNAILFTLDFEPITVIDLPMWAHEIALERQYFRMEVMDPPKLYGDIEVRLIEPKMVTIRAQKFIWIDKSERIIYVTADEEAALLLQSAFLPGQMKDVQEQRKSAFSQGILFALDKMRRW